VAIKLDSRGPLFFVQDRVGRQGKRFRLVKFRTMLPSDTRVSEWERDNHKRLTRVGRHLRRCRLDELPQLYNILRGDMCLVGPRPHPVSNVLLFAMVTRNVPECGEQIPYYALRSLVRPGLTGWAQVRYHYANDLEEEIEKMKYDLYYIKHRSSRPWAWWCAGRRPRRSRPWPTRPWKWRPVFRRRSCTSPTNRAPRPSRPFPPSPPAP